MDEEARYQIHLRNQIKNVSEKISKIDTTKANWIVVHPSWLEEDNPFREYLLENGIPLDKEIAQAIDEEFWDLI